MRVLRDIALSLVAVLNNGEPTAVANNLEGLETHTHTNARLLGVWYTLNKQQRARVPKKPQRTRPSVARERKSEGLVFKQKPHFSASNED